MKTSQKIVLIFIICFIMPIALYAAGEKPIALFNFEKSSYQVSETIRVKDTSYSKTGTSITQREWKAKVNGQNKTAPNISTLLKGARPGNIEVFLRVKDSKGVWSNWTSQQVEIKPLKPLKINNFKAEKQIYAMGEKIQFTYSYDNPNELDIRSQRWRYRNITTGGNFIAGKPKYFNKAGTYEVSFEVQDEWGNWSNKVMCIVKVSSEKIKRNGSYLFNKGKQGDLIEGYIDKDYSTFNQLSDVQVKDMPGTLIVSNSPESIASSGILYKDTSEGEGRLVVHHLNNTNVSKKLMVIASTSADRPVQLIVENVAIKGLHKNILKTGQAALREYFAGKGEKVYTINPGSMVPIYDSSDVKGWEKNEVISGLLDFKSDGPITWTIVSMDAQSPINNISKLSVLKKDQHIRGTFDVLERKYTVNLTDLQKPGKLVIGSGTNEWLIGRDALTGETVSNRGNYGLPVNIQVNTTEDMGIIINARGGGYQGAIKWGSNKVFDVPNEDILGDKKLAALIGKGKANSMTEWTYMLPNGSAAPVLFGFIPEHLWDE